MISSLFLVLALATQDPIEVPELRLDERVAGEMLDDAPVVHSPATDKARKSSPVVARRYRVRVPEAGTYHIDLQSYLFDTYLILRDAAGKVLEEADDGLLGWHSRIVTELDSGRDYVVDACSLHGDRGVFELFLGAGSPPERTPEEEETATMEDRARRVEVIKATYGELSLETAEKIILMGRLFRFQRNTDAAIEYYQRGLRIYDRVVAATESGVGPPSRRVANGLYYLGRIWRGRKDYEQARNTLERAVVLNEATFGPENDRLGFALFWLGRTWRDLGEHEQAQVYLERALATREAAFGLEHEQVAFAHFWLGRTWFDLGDYDRARACFKEALVTEEIVFGAMHKEVGFSLYWLGRIERDFGDPALARGYFERQLAINESVHGPKSTHVAENLLNLGTVHSQLGAYARAEDLLTDSLKLHEELRGEGHVATAGVMRSVGSLLRRTGREQEARSMLERSVKIFELSLNPDTRELALALTERALLYWDMRRRDDARRDIRRALEIFERENGVVSLSAAVALENMAMMTMQEDEALPLIERSLSIKKQLLGPKHQQLAWTLGHRANILRTLGDFDGAMSDRRRCVEINAEALGPEHPTTIQSTSYLAYTETHVAHLRQGSAGHEASLPALRRVFELNSKLWGQSHRETIFAASKLASSLAEAGHLEEACALALDLHGYGHVVYGVGGGAGGRSGTMLSEAEMLAFRALGGHWLNTLVSIVAASGEPVLQERAYERVIEWKGGITRQFAAHRRRLGESVTEAQRALLERLRDCQAELSRAAYRSSLGTGEAEITRLVERRNELELELRDSIDRGEFTTSPSLADVRSSLPAGGALVDILSIEPRLWADGVGGPQQDHSGPPHFYVWIVHAERDGVVQVDLGPVAEIEYLIATYLGRLVAQRGIGVGVGGERGDPEAELRARMWDPLVKHLDGIDKLFISPDGALGTLPWGVLRLKDGTHLIERYAISYVQGAAALPAGNAPGDSGGPGDLLCLGGVNYNARAARPGSDKVARGSPAAASSLRGSFTDFWPQLPGTAFESQVVSDLHEAVFGDAGKRLLLNGTEGTEERLKQEIPRYSTLHLSTHGFFQPEGLPSMWDEVRNASGGHEFALTPANQRLVGHHPGLLSGLVCAGANVPEAEGRDDGYLTAEELSWLDLSGVGLAVLSACETGLGRAQSGEGLLGLRRALENAGVDTVVSSLWSVRDESTSRLMAAFYRNLWQKKMGKLEALRAAQLDMLKANRVEFGRGLPSTWGAFVLSGEWR